MASRDSGDGGHERPVRWMVQIMPVGVGRTRTVSVTRRAVRMAAISIFTSALVVLAFAVSLGVDVAREIELVRLRLANQHLTQNLSRVESQLGVLTYSVDALSAQEQKFRLLAGLPNIGDEVRSVGVGGPLPVATDGGEFMAASPRLAERMYAAAYDAELLNRRIELLGSSIAEAMDSVALHRDVFLGRPSIRPVQAGDSWISSSFSYSRFHPVLQYNRPHPGIDISALAGTPIFSTADGYVSYAGSKSGYGKTVEIDHGYGYVTRYAHVGSISVQRGQRVRRGDEIGEVGRTGLATAPHLHYEVIVDGRHVNPRQFLLDDIIYE